MMRSIHKPDNADGPPLTPTPPQPVLRITDLHVRFTTQDGAVAAVNGLSLTVGVSEIVGIVGESGSGKSTTALAIMRLLPSNSAITSGSIVLDGDDLAALSERQMQQRRGAKVAMIFQDALTALDPTMTIGRQLIESLQLHRAMSREQARTRVLELLRTVGIADPERRFRQYPHELSGGMRQRVMIASALACNPRLLVADEPTTALDVTVQRQILDLIQRLRDLVGAGTILITHDVGVVSEVCDKVAVMYAGRAVESGPTKNVFTQPRHPYTAGLLTSTLDATVDRSQPLHAIPGLPPDLTHLPPGCVFAPRCPKATDICQRQEPPLEDVSPGHSVACWHWMEEA